MAEAMARDIVARIVVDGELCIRSSDGRTGAGLPPGADLLDAMPWLVGYEHALQALLDNSAPPLVIHNIAVMNGAKAPEYLTLTARSAPGNTLEIELRDIGEVAELQAKLLQKHNELALAFDALDQARRTAEEATKSKSAFIANISHELRTPLNVIIGNAELLSRYRDQFDAKELDEYAGDIWKSGHYLLELVNDLLDLAKSEAGQLALVEDVCDFAIIADGAINLTQGLPAARHIRMAVTPPGYSVVLWADARRLKQVLINLLSNAIKFSPDRGRVEISYEVGEDGAMVCEITDQGQGLPAGEIKRILAPFVQGGPPLRGEAGTGLGLTMVQSLVALHQGTFDLLSSPGKGTTARFTLPASRVNSRGPEAAR